MTANEAKPPPLINPLNQGLTALCQIAAYYRIGADPSQLRHELALPDRPLDSPDILRGAKLLRLNARILHAPTEKRLKRIPTPALVKLANSGFALLGSPDREGRLRVIDPLTLVTRMVPYAELVTEWAAEVILITRRSGVGIDPKLFSFRWFLPSLWRYRLPLAYVLFASLFIQLFGLVTPLFFQIVVDKVLVHKGDSTLIVVTVGMVSLGVFSVVLQFLRAYILSHTANRIDVELGARLFYHLLRLPLMYFETRPAGQTVARVRELETIRGFLTGQGLFSLMDLFFTTVLITVLFFYSWFLALVVLCSAPFYVVIAAIVRPMLREKVQQRFNRGAESNQFLVETTIGMHTIKAAAAEPMTQSNWEEKLAAYVKSSFDATLLATAGQNATTYVSYLVTAMIIFFGARAVIAGQLTVGELVAFNMIAAQVVQPILRLSQLFQDFQQFRVSVERLGDILNTPVEPVRQNVSAPPAMKGAIELKRVSFRYRPNLEQVLKDLTLSIEPGEVVGIFGPSGSGKSTFIKLVQRFYSPERGQVLIDGMDVTQFDPVWLRRQIGVVLQENLLFNRTIHDNIALADPGMPRAYVMHMAQLSGAHEFIARLPQGYDTAIEERGANLSGGQRQRIAIARTLATNPRIIIFDEATSSLDYESERIIQRNMQEIVAGRTAIIIAHRLTALRNCKRIIGILDGQIAEQGCHHELVGRTDGLYSHLWSLQNAI